MRMWDVSSWQQRAAVPCTVAQMPEAHSTRHWCTEQPQLCLLISAQQVGVAQEKQLVEFNNARVLVADQKVESIKDIIPVLEQVTRLNQPLLIITEDVAGARSYRSMKLH